MNMTLPILSPFGWFDAFIEGANSIRTKGEIDLQIEAAGRYATDKQLPRWIPEHAAPFRLYLQERIGLLHLNPLFHNYTLQQTKSFLVNFHEVEYSIAKKRGILMREWDAEKRQALCDILAEDHSRLAMVEIFHFLSKDARKPLILTLSERLQAAQKC